MTGADRPAHAPAHDLHHLFGVDLGLAGLDRGRETARTWSSISSNDTASTAARTQPSAAGCRCSTRRARSSARHRAPGPPCATAVATAARDPWCSYGAKAVRAGGLAAGSGLGRGSRSGCTHTGGEYIGLRMPESQSSRHHAVINGALAGSRALSQRARLQSHGRAGLAEDATHVIYLPSVWSPLSRRPGFDCWLNVTVSFSSTSTVPLWQPYRGHRHGRDGRRLRFDHGHLGSQSGH